MYQKREFTLDDYLQEQARQLAEWKSKLNTACYLALAQKAAEMNEKVTEPQNVWRGCQMNDFIGNWKPSAEQPAHTFEDVIKWVKEYRNDCQKEYEKNEGSEDWQQEDDENFGQLSVLNNILDTFGQNDTISIYVPSLS